MNSIKFSQASASSSDSSLSSASHKTSIKIPVKVGSNQIYVSIHKDTKCAQLIRHSLKQCKIQTNKTVLIGDALAGHDASQLVTKRKNYALFERAAGIEQMIKYEQNIFELWSQWKLKHAEKQVEFIVKQCKNSKKISNAMTRNRKCSHKLFEMGRRQAASVPATQNVKISVVYEIQTHLYERIDSDNEDESVEPISEPIVKKQKSSRFFLNKILKNEEHLQEQTQKIVKLDSSILRHVRNVKRIINHLNGQKKTSL